MAQLKAPTTIGVVAVDPRGASAGEGLVFDGAAFTPQPIDPGSGSLFLPLAGGVMTGPIDMDGQELQNAVIPELVVVEAEVVALGEDIDAIQAIIAAPGYLYGGEVVYTANGTFDKADYTVGGVPLRAIKVKCQGGGGGGGGCAATSSTEYAVSGSGAGGGYAESFILVSDLATSEAVTVGQGGNGGAAGNNTGTGGTDSIFDTISGEVRADGGNGGAGSAVIANTVASFTGQASPGTAIGNILAITGEFGSARIGVGTGSTSHFGMPGRGGNSFLGHGGAYGSNNTGGHAGGKGAGGGATRNAASQAARAGGNGSDGVVIVTLYY